MLRTATLEVKASRAQARGSDRTQPGGAPEPSQSFIPKQEKQVSVRTEAESGAALTFRDALADLEGSSADTVFEGAGRSRPLATIAVTVYKRFDYLAEAVQSALDQDFDERFEVIVVDDDPESHFAERLLEQLPALRGLNFRYIVNRQNLGVNGTFNRCIQSARGEWVSILNDDDLLDADFLSELFAELNRRPDVDGLASRKRDRDERGPLRQAPRSLPRRMLGRLLQEALFSGRPSRPITDRKMFWWPVIGNCAGLLFRKEAAQRVGGFYPEEGVAGDYWFFARFAHLSHLRQHRAVAASVRIAKNESMKVGVLRAFVEMSYKLRQALLADRGVPRWWRRFSPLIAARQRAYYRDFWHIDAPDHEVEEWLKIKLPADRPILFRILRLLFRGF